VYANRRTMPDAPQTLGDFIRSARVAADLSLRELARRIAKTPSYLSDIENDRRVPSEDVLAKIADAIGVPFEDLVVRAGRVGEAVQRLVRRSPEAVRLFRTAPDLNEDDLKKLRKQAERMAQKKQENEE